MNSNENVNFFDTLPVEEVSPVVEENFFDVLEREEKAAAQPLTEEATPGFWDPYLENIEERKQQLQGTVKDLILNYWGDDPAVVEALGPSDKRPVGAVEAAVQGTGIVAGGIADTIGQGVVDTAKAVTPDQVKDDIVAGVQWATETPAGKAAMSAFTAGGEAWAAYEKRHPQNAKTIAAVMNVGGLVGLPSMSHKVTKLGDDMVEAGAKGHQRRVGNMLAPLDMLSDRAKGTTDEGGLMTLRAATYTHSPSSMRVVNEVASVPKVNPHRSLRYNRARVLDAVESQKNQLDQAIVQAGNPAINKDAILDDLFKKIDSLDNLDETLTLSGNAKGFAEKMMYKAYDFIDASDGTTLGLLNARRQLDEWIKEFSSKGYDLDAANAKTVAHKIVRNQINDAVDASVESVPVKELLHKQHRLLSGAFDLETKMVASNEGKNMLGRALQQLSGGSHVGPVGAYTIASGVAGGAGFTLSGGSLAAAAAAGGLGLLAARYGKDPVRVVLGNMMKAGGLTKADKIWLIDAMQELDSLSSEEETNE